MFNTILKEKYKFVTDYFELAFKNNLPISHSIVFTGSDTLAQYYMALSIAKILNCKKDKQPDCDCINCKWIKANSHPEVLTISKIDNKPDSDSSKTVISEKQIKLVLDKLVNSSEYKRVFIFCDADKRELLKKEKEHYTNLASIGFEPLYQSEEKYWYSNSLNRKIFQAQAANSLLKSIEEPPSDTYFFFLTNDKDDLLPTIISRSQTFNIASALKNDYDEQIFEVLKNYPNLKKIDALEIADKLSIHKFQNKYSTEYLLDSMQNYFLELVKSNVDNPDLLKKIFEDINQVEIAKQYLKASMKDSIVLEYLMLKISQ